MIRIPLLVALLCAAVFLSGCAQTTVVGVTPLAPKAGLPTPTVDSLTPTLSWQQITEIPCTYDLVIYEAVKLPSRTVIPGKEVYYREGLTASAHRLEQTLRPGFTYLWSLRVRTDGKPRAWSKWNYKDGNYGKTNSWFEFKTPQTAG